MRVLLTGGGTAGHVTPALAIAEIIKDNFKGSEIAFVGRLGGEENRPIKKSGYKLYTVDIEAPKRSLTLKNFRVLRKILSSRKAAREIITEFEPDVIIGTGGYVSYPLLRMGIRLDIPTLIHESNAYPGLVTRLLSKKVNAVMLGIGEAGEHLKVTTNVVTVGNPVRRAFNSTSRNEARQKLGLRPGEMLVVSFGGSGGSVRINDAVVGLMRDSDYKRQRVRHIHASGRKYFESIKAIAPELTDGKGTKKVVPYIENMPEMLMAADIAITRSGAMTLAELAATGTAPILIPSPNVAANHQYKNAAALSGNGAAIMLTEDNLTVDTLKASLGAILRDGIARKTMEHKLRGMSGSSCAENILKVITDTVNGEK